MAVIAFGEGEGEIWIVNRRTMSEVIDSAQAHVTDASDSYALEVARASEGLHFDSMPRARARRLALAVGKAVRDLSKRLESSPDAEERAFVSTLREIECRLESLTEG